MNRFHVHLPVAELDSSIGFHTRLFGAAVDGAVSCAAAALDQVTATTSANDEGCATRCTTPTKRQVVAPGTPACCA